MITSSFYVNIRKVKSLKKIWLASDCWGDLPEWGLEVDGSFICFVTSCLIKLPSSSIPHLRISCSCLISLRSFCHCIGSTGGLRDFCYKWPILCLLSYRLDPLLFGSLNVTISCLSISLISYLNSSILGYIYIFHMSFCLPPLLSLFK